MAARPYRIEVAEEVLDDLRERLARTRWPEPAPGEPWGYGLDLDVVRGLCERWRTGFDWRAWEERLNAWPQFLCEVDGVDLHFWHVRGTGPDPLPLLLVHGWPGSILEFLDLLEPLSAAGYDLVVPALPGFGFGGRPRERGFGIARIAAAFDALMAHELGYRRYGVQGGDWGSIVAARLGSAHADHVAGIHVNMPLAPPPPEAEQDEEDRATLARLQAFRGREGGYSAIQRSKPDTLTVAQTDSPAGLAAWILEKFEAWSDGGIAAHDADLLLANLMFYWAPASVASAARIYHESANEPDGLAGWPPIGVPTAVAAFPAEPFGAPRRWVERHFALARWTEMPRGGHFAALEEPELLLADVRSFFDGIR